MCISVPNFVHINFPKKNKKKKIFIFQFSFSRIFRFVSLEDEQHFGVGVFVDAKNVISLQYLST